MAVQTTDGPTVRIPRPRPLEERLAAWEDLERPEWVLRVKELRKETLADLARQQVERINEVTGLDVAASLAGSTDVLIRACVQRAWRRAGAPADAWQRAGVFALGGYGRGELSPHSDIDLMVLAVDRCGDWLQAGYNELSTLLWDLGFQVGASCRHVAELERILAEDFVTATAVLEQRLLVGETVVDEAMRALRERFRRKRARAFLTYKVAELQGRREKAGANLFLMEPNLKTNPGCLRDVQFLRNASFMLFGSRNLHALRELDVVVFEDVQRLFAANDHFLGIRALLHFQHDRREDVLHLTDQLWIADLLGYAAGGRLKAVEQMMTTHYEHVRFVHEMAELIISRMKALGHLGRRLILIKTRKKLDDCFTAVDGKVYLARPALWEEADLGARLIAMCRLAQRRRFRISIELRRSIAANGYRLANDGFRRDPVVARTMLEILGDLGQVRPILEDMHACGLLGAWLPEFANLRCLLQFNSYHQYTADEHTLIAIGNLDLLANERAEGFPGCVPILKGLPRRDLLGLALLLHDIGKFMGSGHVPRGAMMVHPIALRMGLAEEEEDLVHFLVLQHVTLSDATRTRDIHDPSFLEQMVGIMGDQRHLDYLYVLTWCDNAAVAEGILSGWQVALTQELYEGISRALRGRTGMVEVASRRQRLREALLATGLDAPGAEQHLAVMPQTYQWQAQPEEMAIHRQLLASARQGGIATHHRLLGTEQAALACAVSYRKGMFADIAAALSSGNLDIVDARSWASSDDLLLIEFRLGCALPARLANQVVWKALDKDLRALVAGETSATALLARRTELLTDHRPPDSGFDSIEVRLEQQNSDRATIIDIRVKDGAGLLHLLCRTFAEHDCHIVYASISTYGDVARDVFYLTDEGHKLGSAKAATLRSAVEQALRDWRAGGDRRPALSRRLDLG